MKHAHNIFNSGWQALIYKAIHFRKHFRIMTNSYVTRWYTFSCRFLLTEKISNYTIHSRIYKSDKKVHLMLLFQVINLFWNQIKTFFYTKRSIQLDSSSYLEKDAFIQRVLKKKTSIINTFDLYSFIWHNKIPTNIINM